MRKWFAKREAVLFIAALLLLTACDDKNSPQFGLKEDIQAAAITVGQTVTFSLSAFSNQEVCFYIDNELIARDTTDPYEATWIAVEGRHEIVAVIGCERALQKFTLTIVIHPETTPPVQPPLPETPEQPTLPDKSRVTLRADGTVQINDRPFFSLGFFSDGRRTPEAMKEMIDTVSEAGFNVIVAEPNYYSADDYLNILDEATNKNIYILSHINGDTSLVTDAIKRKPSHLGWDVLDDSNRQGDLANLQRIDSQVRLADDTHLTMSPYTNLLYSDRNAAEWLAAVGLPLIQWYPVTKTGNETRWSYGAYQKLVALANSKGRTLAGIVQAFGNSYETWNYPTAAEIDSMAHAALIAGCKSLFFYTFHDYDKNSTIDRTHPELWEAIKRVASEVKTLESVFLNGTLTSWAPNYDTSIASAKDNDTATSVGVWIHEGFKYLAVNNLTNEAQSVLVYQPGPYSGAPEKMFSYRPDLSFDGTNFTGTLPPLSTTYYRIKLAD